MSNPVTDAAPQILIKIEADTSAFRQSVETRLDRLEEINRKQRRASAGILVMMRATASDFDARVGGVEEHVSALESAGRI